MPRMNKLSSYATTVTRDPETGAWLCIYHSTVIVRWDVDTIRLDMNGWDTVTTRRKMQQCANEYRLPFQVYREAGVTFAQSTLRGQPQPLDGGAVILPRKMG